MKKVNNLIIVGAMANNFIKFKGNKVGKSLIEEGSEKKLKKFTIKQLISVVKFLFLRTSLFQEIFKVRQVLKIWIKLRGVKEY